MTRVRAIAPSMDPAVVAQIDDMLDDIETRHGVRIVWAAESGSRAWGFPSSDSDYDCRFLYVRPQTDYLSLGLIRDVIEVPVDETFDVCGWDVTKALRLLVKGNAQPGEWLRSPIVYRGDVAARDLLLETADKVLPYDGLYDHHFHRAEHTLDLLERTGRAKKFFYVLRASMTMRWMRQRCQMQDGLPYAPLPPMDLQALTAESDVSHDIAELIDELVVVKATMGEAGLLTAPKALMDFALGEMKVAEAYRKTRPDKAPSLPGAWEAIDATFLRLLDYRERR